jgi:prevent-host-death family protein
MKPKEIGVFEAKTRLSELIERVDKGQIYVITKRGRPVAELRPPTPVHGLRFGSDAGQIGMTDDFDAPVDDLRPYSE